MIRVLVVDDEELARTLMRRYLEVGGHEVSEASSAEEALQLLEAELFDVVVTDILMPGTSGVELLDRIRSTAPQPEVILITGAPTYESATDAVRSGAFDYLAKPVEREELTRSVDKAVKARALRLENKRLKQELERHADLLEEQVDERTRDWKRAAERLGRAQRVARLGFVDYDLGSGEVYLSEEAYRLFGIEPRETMTRPEIRELVHPEDRDRVRDEVERVFKGEGAHALDHRIVRPDGEELWVHSEGEMGVSDDGRSRVLHSTIKDITARKKVEEQFLQAQKLEAMGRLAAGVAHDFNNLLTVIMTHTYLLRNRDDNPQLAAVAEATEKAAALTSQLLAFSRKAVARPEVLDLGEVIVESSRLIQRALGDGISLTCEAEPGAHEVLADPGQIQQVLLNLAVNARDAMADGGSLRIDVRSVPARKHEEKGTSVGPFVALAVTDTGPGLDEETRSRIFEPFFTTKGAGTGLGLSAVMGIAKQSGGHVTVKSSLGEGTTIELFLPTAKSQDLDVSDLADIQQVAREANAVLLVDDSDEVRGVAEFILAEAGYDVISASGPADALKAFEAESERISLLVTDVVMPEMDGTVLAERLREGNEALRVLYLSGQSPDLSQALAQAKSDYLGKPFRPPALLSKVRDLLDC